MGNVGDVLVQAKPLDCAITSPASESTWVSVILLKFPSLWIRFDLSVHGRVGPLRSNSALWVSSLVYIRCRYMPLTQNLELNTNSVRRGLTQETYAKHFSGSNTKTTSNIV